MAMIVDGAKAGKMVLNNQEGPLVVAGQSGSQVLLRIALMPRSVLQA